MLEKMTIKEFIINFFYATHIYENYSEYEVWENNPYLNKFEEYPDFIDYLDNKTSRDIECMVYIINSFENGRYKVKTASFDKDLQEDDYDEFDYYIKNVRETFDEDDKESEFYERELKLHEKFEFEIEYYDYEYDIYYAEDKYKELFNNFLKKHDLLGKYSSSENLEITKEEFIAKYYYSLYINDDFSKYGVLRRKDIRLIHIDMSYDEIMKYFKDNNILDKYYEYVEYHTINE